MLPNARLDNFVENESGGAKHAQRVNTRIKLHG